jgi:hypothetical protein
MNLGDGTSKGASMPCPGLWAGDYCHFSNGAPTSRKWAVTLLAGV